MRILLDENMPLDFGDVLPGHDVDHVETLGLKGIKNGELIGLARSSYQAFITLDRGIKYQHNHAGQSLVVLILRANDSRPETIRNRAQDLMRSLETALPGDVTEVAEDT